METNSRTKWAIYNNPLPLLEIKNKKIISAINSYLPWDTGIEIECERPPFYKHEAFTSIPDIVEVLSDSCEQRYRIPPGLKGMICLWNILEACKINLELNNLSGHHYHVDWRDYYDIVNCKENQYGIFLNNNLGWIEDELETWNYTGNYNRKGKSWVRWNPLKTLEFRIGNPTYDYNTIITRIIHAQDISRRLKNIVASGNLFISSKEAELENLRKQLEQKNKLLTSQPRVEQVVQLSNRVNRI